MYLIRFSTSILLTGLIGASLMTPTEGRAATMTVGPPLPMKVAENFVIGCPDSCIVTNPTAPQGTSHLVSSDGVILRWRLFRGSAPSEETPQPGYRLRVLTPFADRFLAAGSSALAVPAHLGTVETFSTRLPVKAGQLIALEAVNGDSTIRFAFSDVATSVFLEPALADGASASEAPGWEDGFVFPFNADVLPPPRVSSTSPSGGSVEGGTEVTVKGDNFSEVTGIEMGGRAAEYTVDSETELTVIAPPRRHIGSVGISVTTIAGSAEALGAYRYEGCVVPRLKGKSLKAVRAALDRRECDLGEVRKRRGATVRTGRVKRQAPRRGTVLPPDASVEVALGLPPKPRR